MWGLLVGDAVGVPYEFGPARPAETVVFGKLDGTWHQPPGTWSDDGALALALLDSIVPDGPARRRGPRKPVFDIDDQGRRALAWRDAGAYTPDLEGRFDIGGTTNLALSRIAEGVPAIDAGPTNEHACGNGSLMRILPVALAFRNLRYPELIEKAHQASRVTHGHPRCQVACAVYCVVVAELLAGAKPLPALHTAFEAAELVYLDGGTSYNKHGAALMELIEDGHFSGSGYVIDSFQSAWAAFVGAEDYADAIRRAVAYGKDTDTTAAIAGGLAGAYWGWDGIPLEWRRGMRGRAVAQPIIDRLVETINAGRHQVRTSTSSPLLLNELDLTGTELEGRGRVGLTFLPGKKRDGYTGPHWRDLDIDLARMRASGVDALLLLNEKVELEFCLVPEIDDVMAADGPELIPFPIRDPRTPDGREAEYRAVVRDLVERVRGGAFVVIACRGGVDRTGMTAVVIYRELGLDADEAIARVQAARHGTITLTEQQDFVRAWPWGVEP